MIVGSMPDMEEHELTDGNLPELALGLASNESPVLTLQAEHRSSDIEKGKVFSLYSLSILSDV